MNLKLEQGTISHLTNRNDHHTMSTVRITLLLSLQSKDFRGHSQRTASEGQKCSRHPNITDRVPKLQMSQPGSLQRNLLMGITGHHPPQRITEVPQGRRLQGKVKKGSQKNGVHQQKFYYYLFQMAISGIDLCKKMFVSTVILSVICFSNDPPSMASVFTFHCFVYMFSLNFIY